MSAYARGLFGSAAAFNLVVGGGLLFARSWLASTLSLDPIQGTSLVLANLTGAMIVVFGLAYACVARDPVEYRPFVGLGALGKAMAVACAVVPWLMGAIPSTLPALMGADLVFAALFLDYLRRAPRATAAAA